jgi:pimeloyl-ACP methyl ester carboxylesterase/DNA-binding CsgD family transcriptional regulator
VKPAATVVVTLLPDRVAGDRARIALAMDAPPVQYVKTSDGYNIAYTDVGDGRPFVFMPMRRNHIQLAWEESPTAEWLEGLASRFRLIQYDSRGQGLSTRNVSDDFLPRDYLTDLETLVDHLQLHSFTLMAHALFGHVAVRYTVASPRRVRALVLCAVRPSMPTIRWLEMARQNWRLFLFQQVGGAALTADERDKAMRRLEQTTTQKDFVTSTGAFLNSTIEPALSQIEVPTLVLHPRDFPVFGEEESIKVAYTVPGARMVPIEGATAPGDAAQGLAAIDRFMQELPITPETSKPVDNLLSAREAEVLRLIAVGKSNPQIADELVISLNTVQRHVSNILTKTGAANRTEAALYARERGLA